MAKDPTTPKKKPLRSALLLGDTSLHSRARTLRIVHPDDTSEFLYLDGDEKQKPITFQVVGNESDEYIEANHENRAIINQRAMDQLPYDAQIEDNAGYRCQAYCTKGWGNVPTGWLDGTDNLEPLEWSRDTAFLLFKRLPWLRQQIQIAIWDRKNANFAEAS